MSTVEIVPNGGWQNRSPRGWLYKDRAGTHSGVQNVQLKPGKDGRSKVSVRASGANLPVPVPYSNDQMCAQAPAVTVQLINSLGMCWTSEFMATGTRKNTGTLFKAKAP